MHLSPLFSSKEIDLARSCSGLFFLPLRHKLTSAVYPGIVVNRAK